MLHIFSLFGAAAAVVVVTFRHSFLQLFTQTRPKHTPTHSIHHYQLGAHTDTHPHTDTASHRQWAN